MLNNMTLEKPSASAMDYSKMASMSSIQKVYVERYAFI